MKIIILGAGQVGSSVAANLCSEANDITVIDRNPAVLRNLRERLDLKTINGSGSHPSALDQAGARDADMIIAVTNSDETNMVACQVAYTVFHTPTKIARVRNNEYLSSDRLFALEAMPVDVLISPEQVVTEYIARLIGFPGALQVLDFASGRVQMVAVKMTDQSVIAGKRISDLAAHMPKIEFRIVSIFRGGRAIIPDGDTEILADDEVFIIGAPKHIRNLLKSTRQTDKPVKRIIIASGGNIGRRLAKLLENRYQVKVIELSTEKAQKAAEELNSAIVLNGDAADEETPDRGKHRRHRRLLRPDQCRRGQYHLLHAGETPGSAQGHGPDQPGGLRGPGAERRHRYCNLAATGHHRQPAGAYTQGRRRGGAFTAARRRRGNRGGCSRRPDDLQRRRQVDRGNPPCRRTPVSAP